MDVMEERIVIRAAPVQIMPFLIEPELLETWAPTKLLVKRLSRRKEGPGTRLQLDFVGHGADPIIYEIVEQTETLLLWSFEGRMSGEDRWELSPKGKSTDVFNRMTFRAPDTLTLIGWKTVGRAIAAKDVRGKMPLLRDVVERIAAGDKPLKSRK